MSAQSKVHSATYPGYSCTFAYIIHCKSTHKRNKIQQQITVLGSSPNFNMCWVQLQNRSENATLMKILATTPADTLPLLRGWQVNPDGVPPAIHQEEDGLMNLLNVDIWLWMQTIAPSIAPVVFKWVLWKIFQEKGQWATLTKGITPPSLVGDTLRSSIKCQFDWGV